MLGRIQAGDQESSYSCNYGTYKEGQTCHALASYVVLEENDCQAGGEVRDARVGEELEGRGAHAFHITAEYVKGHRDNHAVKEICIVIVFSLKRLLCETYDLIKSTIVNLRNLGVLSRPMNVSDVDFCSSFSFS